MAKRGIDNVLGALVGSPLEPANTAEQEERKQEAPVVLPELPVGPVKSEATKVKTAGRPVVARRGRPPGSRPEGVTEKKKVTWSIDPVLYEAFVRRSYREECQVWELLERAIKEYLKKPEKE